MLRGLWRRRTAITKPHLWTSHGSKARYESTSRASSATPLSTAKWTVQATTWFIGVFLGWHIGTGYFYSYESCYGISMLPTINSTGDWALISKYYRRGRGVDVGDMVSFYHPIDTGGRAIKRIIGMPGDFVERDTPGTSGTVIQVPQGHCWVVGDNLTYSQDSRHFGPLPLALINGRVIAVKARRAWPHWTTNTLQKEDDDDID